jgi:hypothetical protein
MMKNFRPICRFFTQLCFVGFGLNLCATFAQNESPQQAQGPAPLPGDGSNSLFTYSRSSATSTYYIVKPTANPDSPFLVSDNFLGLVLNNGAVDIKTQFTLLTQYPVLMNALYSSRMSSNYPSAADNTYETPFEPVQTEGLSIVQDDLASPYVRVRLVNPDGTIDEFSINRNVVDRILADQDWEVTNLVGALRSYSYRLPEKARVNFRFLTPAQIFEMAESTPGVAKQEFVRTRRLYRELKIDPTMSNAAAFAANKLPVQPLLPPPAPAFGPLRKSVAIPIPTVVPKKAPRVETPVESRPESGLGRNIGLGAILIVCVGVAFAVGRRAGVGKSGHG